MHTVEKIVAQALARIDVKRCELILVALSGGPDSVALTRALAALKPRLGLRLCAAHLNHGLRGEESERDECFTRALCEQLAVPLVVEVAAELTADAANLEERARVLRLGFLRRAAAACGATRIALAHNRDDQAETVLMRLLRGAGAAGLKGMTEAGPGPLIRPLLRASRQEILDYLATLGCCWMTDSSNRSLARLRNRIRHELIPLLESRYAAGLSRRLNALGVEMEQLDELLTGLARRELEHRLIRPEAPDPGSHATRGFVAELSGCDRLAAAARGRDTTGLEFESFEANERRACATGLERLELYRAGQAHADIYPSGEGQRDFDGPTLGELLIGGLVGLPTALISALIREFIAQKCGSLRRVGRAHIDAIVRLCVVGPPNGRVSLPGRFRLRREYDRLSLERDTRNMPAPRDFDLKLNVPGVTVIEPVRVKFDAELIAGHVAVTTAGPNEAWFDAGELGDGLRVRKFRPGDRIRLTCGGSGRKLKRLFQEQRVPRPYRAVLPVVTLNGVIVWIPGIARADYALVKADTDMALRLRADLLIARWQTPVLAFSQVKAK